MLPEVKALIEHFQLVLLPVEGTLFCQTYRAKQETYEGRLISTAMVGLYCDEPRSLSLFHKLAVDEVWHFYAGDPFRLVLLYPDGSSRDLVMGNDPINGHAVQCVVPAGVWQAGHMIEGGCYSLYGCTLAPGFTGEIFEGGERDILLSLYPDRAADIEALSFAPGCTRLE